MTDWRWRSAIAALLVGLLSLLAMIPAAAAAAPLLLAQDTDTEAGEPADEGDEAGAGEEEAETGVGEEETGTATEEEGPPWTYQMARIILAMTLLLFLAMGLMYRRLVMTRQRG